MAEQMATDGGFYARVGGEEFWAVFKGRDLDSARRHLEATTEAVSGAAIPHPNSVRPVVTFSIGLARRAAPDTRWQEVVARADKALYTAKDQGRARMVVEDQRPRRRGAT